MAEISAKIVKDLREMTGAGMMDCKKALIESNGDLDGAVEILRKAGMAKAAKKLDRESKEGRVETILSADARTGAMLLLSCETDFVAKNDDFIAFAKNVVELAHAKKICCPDSLIEQELGGIKIADSITNLIAKIGENISARRLAFLEVEGEGIVHSYIHPGNKIGVMVLLGTDKPAAPAIDKLRELAKEICMHIAFARPLALCEAEIDPNIVANERRIYEELAIEEKKAEIQIPKIIEGKLRKFFEENCLLNQKYIRDEEITIKKLVDKYSAELGMKVELRRFLRFEVGASS